VHLIGFCKETEKLGDGVRSDLKSLTLKEEWEGHAAQASQAKEGERCLL